MAEITILSTKTQKKYTVQVQGNTLADLKAVMSNNGIDYQGMTFFEGRTKTELKSDQSTFPENAVIRLTKSEKKITSGAELTSRKDCQLYIQKHPAVADLIKKNEGKNWTNCGTAVLLDYCIKDAKGGSKSAPKAEPAKPAKPAATAVAAPKAEPAATCECGCAESKEAWIEMGISKGFIDSATATQLRNAVKVESLSQEDLDLFKGI